MAKKNKAAPAPAAYDWGGPGDRKPEPGPAPEPAPVVEERARRPERVMVQLTTEAAAWVRRQGLATHRSDSGVIAELIDAGRENRKPLLAEKAPAP